MGINQRFFSWNFLQSKSQGIIPAWWNISTPPVRCHFRLLMHQTQRCLTASLRQRPGGEGELRVNQRRNTKNGMLQLTTFKIDKEPILEVWFRCKLPFQRGHFQVPTLIFRGVFQTFNSFRRWCRVLRDREWKMLIVQLPRKNQDATC